MPSKKTDKNEPGTLKFIVTVFLIFALIPLPFAIFSAIVDGSFWGIFAAHKEFIAAYIVGLLYFVTSTVFGYLKENRKDAKTEEKERHKKFDD